MIRRDASMVVHGFCKKIFCLNLVRLLAVTLALGLLFRKPIVPGATLDVPPKSEMKSNVILTLLRLFRNMSDIEDITRRRGDMNFIFEW